MMNLTNFHSHCNFCDGKAPMEDFVKSAIVAGFTAYGISSHAPLPFDTRWTMRRDRVDDYLEEIRALKEKYRDKIELYAGMEIDYLQEEWNPAIAYFQHLPLDYRIGSVHLIKTDKEEIIDTDTDPDNFRRLLEHYFHGDLKSMIGRYLDASFRMVEAGGFDIVGHTNKIAYNVGMCDPEMLKADWYRRRIEDYFALVAEKGLKLEINTKAYLRKGCFFPDRLWFPLLKALQVAVVVNSDAHTPELINAGRMEALQALKEVGFQKISELKAGKWEEVGIE